MKKRFETFAGVARRVVLAPIALMFLLATLLVASPSASAWAAGSCQFAANATNLRMYAYNSTGQSGSAVTNRLYGAYDALNSWANTDAPSITSSGSGSSGQIWVDIASNQYPHHGVTEWSCPNGQGTGSSELYPYNWVSIKLGSSFNKPRSTWDHVNSHEYGHGLGLHHSGWATTNIMGTGWPDTNCTGCKTYRSSDDRNGINAQYI